jgi:hypothetical protein
MASTAIEGEKEEEDFFPHGKESKVKQVKLSPLRHEGVW